MEVKKTYVIRKKKVEVKKEVDYSFLFSTERKSTLKYEMVRRGISLF